MSECNSGRSRGVSARDGGGISGGQSTNEASGAARAGSVGDAVPTQGTSCILFSGFDTGLSEDAVGRRGSTILRTMYYPDCAVC